jgi:glycosylphosphatidylinositol transamidase (GPIT) subunit GPI8
MCEPWYQMNTITKEYIQNDMKNTFILYHQRPSFLKITEILKIIDKNIDNEYKKYNGFGSLRGYATFTRNTLMLNINKDIEQKKRQLSIQKIKSSSILTIWINNILYRPPDNNGKYAGLRYSNVKKSFEDKAQKNITIE